MTKKPYLQIIEARQHTPVYLIHKYFARRPHNVFGELISYYTEPGAIILDPFCGADKPLDILRRK